MLKFKKKSMKKHLFEKLFEKLKIPGKIITQLINYKRKCKHGSRKSGVSQEG